MLLHNFTEIISIIYDVSLFPKIFHDFQVFQKLEHPTEVQMHNVATAALNGSRLKFMNFLLNNTNNELSKVSYKFYQHY